MGTWDGAAIRSYTAQRTHQTGMVLTVTNGGCCDLVGKITARATITDGTSGGKVIFYCGDMVQTVPFWQLDADNNIYAECQFNGADLGGSPSQAFTLTAVYMGGMAGPDYYTNCEAFTGVNVV